MRSSRPFLFSGHFDLLSFREVEESFTESKEKTIKNDVQEKGTGGSKGRRKVVLRSFDVDATKGPLSSFVLVLRTRALERKKDGR